MVFDFDLVYVLRCWCLEGFDYFFIIFDSWFNFLGGNGFGVYVELKENKFVRGRWWSVDGIVDWEMGFWIELVDVFVLFLIENFIRNRWNVDRYWWVIFVVLSWGWVKGCG